MMCERKGAVLKVIPVDERGEIILDEYYKLLSAKTRIVAVAQVSNALGTILPIDDIIKSAHSMNIPVLIDGAQGAQHGITDVTTNDCDFYAFSGHKIYGPTGIGVLYGKEKWLSELPPYQGGGDMVDKVTFEKTTFNQLPFKFEAGTINYAGAIGLGKALDYVLSIGREDIASREKMLLHYANERLSAINNLDFGNSENKIPTISFLLAIFISTTRMVLDDGNSCLVPLCTTSNATVRNGHVISMCFYNTTEEIISCTELKRF
jgi:cysteine desulfurase/selenocysteine lyase